MAEEKLQKKITLQNETLDKVQQFTNYHNFYVIEFLLIDFSIHLDVIWLLLLHIISFHMQHSQ